MTTIRKIAYLLTRTLGVGVVKGRKLLDCADLSSMEDFLSSAREYLNEKDYVELIRAYETTDFDRWERELSSEGAFAVAYGETEYPQNLSPYGDMPILLYGKGNRSLLHAESFAVVGTRYPTRYGVRATEEFVKELSSRFCIVSGMARGVDGIAHRTALDCGGRTVAVLGCGVDVVYPAENADLYREIVSNGLVVSELPLGAAADAGNFPARNRIISGLSRAVLLTEAGVKSGTLHTANYAVKQGKTVYGVPGSIYSDRSAGINALIRNGEIMAVTSPEDIFEDFGEKNFFGETKKREESEKKSAAVKLSDEELRVLNYLEKNGETHFEELLAKTDLPIFRLTAILVKLEAVKKIMKTDSNFWSVY